MRGRSNHLFSEYDLAGTLDNQRNAALKEVESMSRDQLLATTIDTLVEHLVSKHSMTPLVVADKPSAMDNSEKKINVTGRFEYGLSYNRSPVFADGHELTFFLPYTGDATLWKMEPNVRSSMPPTGEVDTRQSLLRLTFANTSNVDASWYQSELQRELNGIKQMVSAQTAMISAYNQALPSQIRAAVERRRAQLDKLQGLTSGFDIPLVKKGGMPEFRPIEVAKRVIVPLPRPPATGYKAEPAIVDSVYDEILAIIRHTGASFEGTPQTYMSLGEDGLRDTVLSHINVVFEGKATGETFRKYGKTDIRIEEENRAAFVGECKLWGGEKILMGALDQLLGYLTWRDCKTALIFFNKDVAGFSSIQSTIESALASHPNFLRAKPIPNAGEWRLVFKSSEDASREVTVHVFAFNLYVAPERASKKR